MQWHSDDRYISPLRLHLVPSPSPLTPLVTPKPTQVLLICQGQSTVHTAERSQADEATLTETGRMMARRTGAWLRGTPVDVIYASPLKRSQQTIKELLVGMEADWHHLSPIHLHWHLQEINVPDGQGAMSGAPDPASQPASIPAIEELYDRARQFWQSVLPRHSGQTLLVVGHSSINQALINTALGFPTWQPAQFQQSQGNVSILSFTDSASPSAQLHTLNATHHLGAGLPELKTENQGLRLLLLPVSTTATPHKQVRELLQAVDINFSLSAEEVSHDLMTAILQDHPQTVHLHIARRDFAQVWQRSIVQRKADTANLITGLLVAPIRMIQALLQQAIGIKQHAIQQLAIQAESLSIVHYPSHSNIPVLQAINLGLDGRTLV